MAVCDASRNSLIMWQSQGKQTLGPARNSPSLTMSRRTMSVRLKCIASRCGVSRARRRLIQVMDLDCRRAADA